MAQTAIIRMSTPGTSLSRIPRAAAVDVEIESPRNESSPCAFPPRKRTRPENRSRAAPGVESGGGRVHDLLELLHLVVAVGADMSLDRPGGGFRRRLAEAT